MKKTFAGLILALTLLLGAIAPSAGAYAEEEATSGSALRLTPSGARLTLSPGDVLEDKAEHCPKENDDGCAISVENIGTEPIRVRMYISPYAVKGENNDLSFSEEASTTYTQLSKWITLKNADGEYVAEVFYDLQPSEKRTVPYRVLVPEDLPGGSQYAVIWAQIVDSTETGGIETVSQVGGVVTGRSTVNSVESLEIKEYDFTRFAFHGPLYATATLENTGNVDFAGKSTYTAKTLFGKELYSDEVMTAAYPGTTYHVNMEWSDAPFLGIFHVEFKVAGADTERSESHIVVIMPIIVMIIVILLLTVIVIWIIIICRKRKERKARKLA